MKKSLGLSLVAATLLAGNAMADMKLGEGLTLTGDVRALYFSESGNVDENALGLGLNPTVTYGMDALKFEAGLGVAVPVMESVEDQAAGFGMGASPDTAGDGSDMYATLTKLNVAYDFGMGFVKVGYQQLDTPLAGSDDIRLVPNTFLAAVVGVKASETLTVVAAHVAQMAGKVDGGAEDPQTYNSMSDQALVGALGSTNDAIDDNGVNAIALVYAGKDDMKTKGQFWYYMMADSDSAATIGDVTAMYLDAGLTVGPAGLAAQYISYDDDRGNASSIGLKAEVGVAEGVAVIAAYNSFSSDNGNAPAYYSWGGYPEYAVADELWASSANWDGGTAMKLAAAYSGIENLEVAAGYVAFSDVGAGIDVIANYKINEQTTAGIVYETVTLDDAYKTTNLVDDYSVMKLKAAYAF